MYQTIYEEKGFTLMELAIVMAIIGVLTSIGLVYFKDILDVGRDTAAVSDAQNFMITLNDNLTNKLSVDYTALGISAEGDVEVGVKDTDGNDRPPAFTLSPGVQIIFEPASNPTDNMSFEDETKTSLMAYFYHDAGSNELTGLAPHGIKRRYVELLLNEVNDTQEIIRN